MEASGLLKMSSMLRAARLHLRKGRSSRLNGLVLLLLLLLRRMSSRLDRLVLLLLLLLRRMSSRLDGWELLRPKRNFSGHHDYL